MRPTRPTRVPSWIAAVAVACAAAVPTVALAQAGQAPSAGFRVRIIEGSKGGPPKVDPRLGDLKRELEVLHHDYNAFALVGDQNLRLGIGQRGTVKLPDGAEVAIQLIELVAGPPLRIRHQFELPRSRTVRAVAPGGRTLDVRPWADKLVIICTSVER